jgi:hypothetical protein
VLQRRAIPPLELLEIPWVPAGPEKHPVAAWRLWSFNDLLAS